VRRRRTAGDRRAVVHPANQAFAIDVKNLLGAVRCNVIRKRDLEPPPFFAVLVPGFNFLGPESGQRKDEGSSEVIPHRVTAEIGEIQVVPRRLNGMAIKGGAGIPAFYTPTGVGTMVAEGKETRGFEGRTYVMERGLKADFAFVKAWKGDREGNLIYRKTARNFNPLMATAATITIAEVEHLVEVGELDGDQIHTPSIYVKRIFQGELYERRIERRTVRKAV